MSKKFILLTIILLFVSTILATLTYLYKTSTTTSFYSLPSTHYSQPASQPPRTAALTFLPIYLSTTAAVRTQIEINIEATGEHPTTIQIELAYNPMALTNVQITPGNFIENPNILLNHIDQYTGRISYALTTQPLPTTPYLSPRSLLDRQSFSVGGGEGGPPTHYPNATLATISFIPLFTGQNTTLSFLPKTALYTNNQKITIKQTQAATIQVLPPINPPTQAPQLTPPANKNIHSK